jgi:outer membrane protein assembly factor BamA
VKIGDPFSAATIADVTARLRASKKFHEISVLKRFASISDPTKVVLVVIVNEGAVRVDAPDVPGSPISVVRKRGLQKLMVMPIIDAEDGYGTTFGARLAVMGVAGRQSRLSFPLSWGGMKRAGVEIDRPFARGPLSRVSAGGALQRQRNPAFLENDDRRRLWGRAERVLGPVRLGATAGWQHVSFAGERDSFRSVGGDVAFDTRIDPVLPRNAVYARASWEHLKFASGGDTNRTQFEGRGYVGLVGQTVLALQAVREDADRRLPRYLKPLLGGFSSLRGFKAGSFNGDTLVSGSAELRIPLSSPLEVGKFGVSIFVDAGTAYDKGARFRDQPLQTGVGASAWFVAAMFHVGLSVAHGRGADTRVNFGAGFTF